MWTALLLIILAVYFIPTILAAYLRVPGFWVIFAVNLFLGWTIAGWGVALAWVLQRTGIIGGRDERDLEYRRDADYFPRPPRG
jgi:hypothetical protein